MHLVASSQVDYILFPRQLCSHKGCKFQIKDVIPGEQCIQHPLLACNLKIAVLPKAKCKLTTRLRLWNMRPKVCSGICEQFSRKCTNRPAADGTEQSSVQMRFGGNRWVKDNLNSAIEEMCHYSKNNHPWREETWFWNDKVSGEAVMPCSHLAPVGLARILWIYISSQILLKSW